MNLAEATAQLRQKESEKMTCLDEIQKLEVCYVVAIASTIGILMRFFARLLDSMDTLVF